LIFSLCLSAIYRTPSWFRGQTWNCSESSFPQLNDRIQLSVLHQALIVMIKKCPGLSITSYIELQRQL